MDAITRSHRRAPTMNQVKARRRARGPRVVRQTAIARDEYLRLALGGRGALAMRSGRDLEYALAGIGPRRQALTNAIERLANGSSEWLRRHWLAVVNVALGAFIGVAVLVP